MAYQIEGVGNLGANPEKKTVIIGDEEKPVVNLRIYFDRRVSDGHGGFVDKGGFWRDVAVWKPALGDRIMTHLRKGSRVFVRGSDQARSWTDTDGKEHMSYTVNADYIAADLLGIESVQFSRRRQDTVAGEDEEPNASGIDPGKDEEAVADAAD